MPRSYQLNTTWVIMGPKSDFILAIKKRPSPRSTTMRKVGTDKGNISAAFTNFNQEKEAQLLKEVEEEDRKAEEAAKKINAVLHAKKKKENERLQRRENMLALGMLEEDLNALGLGLIEIDDDPSLCTLVAKAWRKSSCRAGIIKAWLLLPCNRARAGPRMPPADDRFIVGGATRHK